VQRRAGAGDKDDDQLRLGKSTNMHRPRLNPRERRQLVHLAVLACAVRHAARLSIIDSNINPANFPGMSPTRSVRVPSNQVQRPSPRRDNSDVLS
jgi:hypothetical protein